VHHAFAQGLCHGLLTKLVPLIFYYFPFLLAGLFLLVCYVQVCFKPLIHFGGRFSNEQHPNTSSCQSFPEVDTELYMLEDFVKFCVMVHFNYGLVYISLLLTEPVIDSLHTTRLLNVVCKVLPFYTVLVVIIVCIRCIFFYACDVILNLRT
jgi:hypothetical protein